MNENEFDRTARAWLDDGPTRMSDRAVLSTLEEIHTTRQRRAWWPARRATPVSILARVGVSAILLVAVGLLAINVGPHPPDAPIVGGPTTPSSEAPAVDFPAMTTTFDSPTYGYSFKFIDRGGLTPAREVWDPVNQQADIDFDPAFDAVETGLSAYFEAASVELPDGVSTDAWVDEYVAPGRCNVPDREEITIDGESGRIAECPGEIDATVVTGGRIYLFRMESPRGDRRAWFDAWIATIDLTPETVPAPSASP